MAVRRFHGKVDQPPPLHIEFDGDTAPLAFIDDRVQAFQRPFGIEDPAERGQLHPDRGVEVAFLSGTDARDKL
jgi:hypothetical protein